MPRMQVSLLVLAEKEGPQGRAGGRDGKMIGKLPPLSTGNLRWMAPTESDREQPNLFRRHPSFKVDKADQPPKITSPICNLQQRWERKLAAEAYAWQRLPWDNGKPDTQTKDDWIGSLSSAAFCPECGGFVRSDEHGEAICEACGLVGARALYYDVSRITEAINDEKAFHTTHTHNPSKKKELKSAAVDRRVENIALSLDNFDKITELKGDRYFTKMSGLLELYNNDPMNYTPITRFQLRDSYEKRIGSRREAKIDRLIEKMLLRTLHPIDDKIINAICQHDPVFTETFFPELFLYDGTRRIKRPDLEEDTRLKQKLREHRRSAQVRDAQERSIIPAVIHRTYSVGIEIKTITFTFMYNKIYMSGDELGNRFENFFLSEAIRRGYVKEERDVFLSRFRQLGGFIKDPFYDGTPYLQQKGKH